MRDGGDSTKINNILQKLREDLKISKQFYKNYVLCIFFKIIQKVFQFKIIKKRIQSEYLNKLEKELI